jgi:hypothetical protein
MKRDAAELHRILHTYSLGEVKAERGESWADYIMRCFEKIVNRQTLIDETFTEQAAQIREYAEQYEQLQGVLNDALNELEARDLLAKEEKRLASEVNHLEEIVAEREREARGGPKFLAGYTGGDVGLTGGAISESLPAMTDEEREKERVRRSAMG